MVAIIPILRWTRPCAHLLASSVSLCFCNFMYLFATTRAIGMERLIGCVFDNPSGNQPMLVCCGS